MSQHDILHLTQAGRRAYTYWPILLMLKQRQLEHKLANAGYLAETTDTGVDPALHFLQTHGFPVPDAIADHPPSVPPPAGVRFWCRVASAFDAADVCVLDLIRQLANGKYERLELLRVDATQQAYLVTAAERFNAGLDVASLTVVYAAARLWAHCHGSPIGEWQAIAAQFVDTPPPTASTSPFTFDRSNFFSS